MSLFVRARLALCMVSIKLEYPHDFNDLFTILGYKMSSGGVCLCHRQNLVAGGRGTLGPLPRGLAFGG